MAIIELSKFTCFMHRSFNSGTMHLNAVTIKTLHMNPFSIGISKNKRVQHELRDTVLFAYISYCTRQ